MHKKVCYISLSSDEDPEEVHRESMARKLTEDIKAASLETYIAWMEGMGTSFALTVYNNLIICLNQGVYL